MMKSEKKLIDADALTDSLKEWLSASNVICDWDVYHTIEDCICEVNAQPTVDAVEVVHGRWVQCEDWDLDYECSVCGCYAGENKDEDYNILTPYCPNCGAKMDGDRNE